MLYKPVVCLNDETAEDDKASEIEECSQVPREVKSVKGQQGTFVSLMLPAT